MTNDEVLAQIEARAKELGDGRFWLQLTKKVQGFPVIICSFDEVSLEHLARPEGWLPAFAGGGAFGFNVGHPDQGAAVAWRLAYTFGDKPREKVDLALASSPVWRGPKIHEGTAESADVQPTTFAEAAPQGSRQVSVLPQAPAQPTDLSSILFQLEERRRSDEIQRRVDDDRRAREQREFMAAMLEKIKPHEVAPAPRLPIAEIIAAATPILSAVMASSREGAERQLSIMKAMNEQQARFMETMAQAPKVDPLVAQLISKMEKLTEKSMSAPAGPDLTDMVTQTTTAMSQMMKLSASAVALAAEARLEGGGGGVDWKGMVKEALTGVQAFSQTMLQRGAPQPARPPQPQLPPQPPGPPPQGQPADDDDVVGILAEEIIAGADGIAQHPDGSDVVPQEDIVSAVVDAIKSNEPTVIAALTRHNGNISEALGEAIEKKVGANALVWLQQAPKRLLYIQQLWGKFNEAYKEAGLAGAEGGAQA